MFFTLHPSNEIMPLTELHAAHNSCRTDTSENKSIISQIKKVYNGITHKISSCFISKLCQKVNVNQNNLKRERTVQKEELEMIET